MIDTETKDFGAGEQMKHTPTAAEIDETRQALEAWHAPNEFRKRVHALSDRINNATYFNSPKTKFLRDDAWILAEFAVLANVGRVRLSARDDEPADGYIDLAGRTLPVQITEADRRGRKRGDEYCGRQRGKSAVKLASGTKGTDEPEEPKINKPDELRKALMGAIERKASKNYADSNRLVLVVNLNMGDHGRWTTATSDIAAIKQRYARHFAEIYVLWKNRVY